MRRNVLWLAFSQGGLFVVQFGGSVIITRLLTPYEMGVYAVAVATASLMTAFRAMGLTSFIIREPELTVEVETTVFTINALLSVTVGLGIILLSSLGASWLGEPGVATVMILLALTPVLGIGDMLPAAMLERAGRFKALALTGLAKSVLSTAVTIGMALHGWSYLSIAYGNLAGTVVGLVGVNIVGWRYARFRVGFHDWRRVTRFGVQMLSISGLGSVSSKVSDILVGRFIGLGALGLYSRAAGLQSILWDNLNMIVSRAVFVDLAAQRRAGVPVRSTYLRILAIMTAVLWPVFIGLAILAGPAIHTVYGVAWLGSAVPLSLLSVSAAVSVTNTMFPELLLVNDEAWRLCRFELKRVATGLALFSGGCLAGIVGAAAARIGEAACTIAYARPDIARLTGTGWGDVLPILGRSAVLTFAACAPSVALMTSHGWSPQTPLPLVGAAIAMGVFAWIAALWLMKHPLFDEVRVVARHLAQPLRRATRTGN